MVEKASENFNEIEVLPNHREKGRRLSTLLEEEILLKTTLPNHGEDYNLERKITAFNRFKDFVVSSSYDDIADSGEMIYVGE